MAKHPDDVSQVTLEFPMTLEGRMTVLRWSRPGATGRNDFMVVATNEPEAWRKYELLNEQEDEAQKVLRAAPI